MRPVSISRVVTTVDTNALILSKLGAPILPDASRTNTTSAALLHKPRSGKVGCGVVVVVVPGVVVIV